VILYVGSNQQRRSAIPFVHSRCPVVAQGCLDQAAPYRSAFWGAPAAHTRAVEVVGAAESEPTATSAVRRSN
jgi:hypothetical protein